MKQATMKQLSMLLNICTYIMKINSKHFTSSRMAPKHPKWQIFITQRFIQTFILGEKPKTCSEGPHLASGHFMEVFYKATICPRRPLLIGPKSGCLIQVWLYPCFQLQNIFCLSFFSRRMFTFIAPVP